MTSFPRSRANRSNCLRSTGPKTQAGRAKSAQNARRHGLRVPVLYDPQLAEDVERLAQKIACARASGLIDLTRKIAEAEVEVLRIRHVRNERVWAHGVENVIINPSVLGELAVFDRYERRALSRRKFAIRAFVAAYTDAMKQEKASTLLSVT